MSTIKITVERTNPGGDTEPLLDFELADRQWPELFDSFAKLSEARNNPPVDEVTATAEEVVADTGDAAVDSEWEDFKSCSDGHCDDCPKCVHIYDPEDPDGLGHCWYKACAFPFLHGKARKWEYHCTGMCLVCFYEKPDVFWQQKVYYAKHPDELKILRAVSNAKSMNMTF